MGNKHYIRLDGNKIIKFFSDAFEQPLETDICINENGDRHVELNGCDNPQIHDGSTYLYKYVDGQITELTAEEKSLEMQQLNSSLSFEEMILVRSIEQNNRIVELERKMV